MLPVSSTPISKKNNNNKEHIRHFPIIASQIITY